MRQEGAQRLAYPVGEARCFPVHGFRDAEALNGLKDRCASGAALYKADPALPDINTHNRALFAEQRTEGRGREESGGVVAKEAEASSFWGVLRICSSSFCVALAWLADKDTLTPRRLSIGIK